MSQSERVSFKNGRRPFPRRPMKTPLSSTTWHNLLGTALATSKAFFLCRVGDKGRARSRDGRLLPPMESRSRAVSSNGPSCHGAPVVMQHCCYVSYKSLSFIAPQHFLPHAALRHILLISVILLSNVIMCACTRLILVL